MLASSLEAEFLRFQATSWVHYTTSYHTQFSTPEDYKNYFPKHVELIGIINIPLLLHLVGCLYYLDIFLRDLFNGKRKCTFGIQ